MERAVVRSSARLSGGGGGGSGKSGGGGGPSKSGGGDKAEAARRAAAAALAAERRERARQRAQEVEDSPSVLRDKCRELARVVRQAKHLVVYTGAGISTAADIPDYRGPHGVWTRLQRGEDIGRVEVSRAQPTFTHMALTALVARGLCKFVVSQNCDGLHVRAGLPRRALAELHGDMFAERCAAPACRAVLLRAFDTTQRTGRYAHGTRRTCPVPRCGRPLRDTIVHFGERARAAWPLNWAGALRHAAAADVILCLGSSLKVLRRYPRLWCMARPARARPRLYIVNLQWTPKDTAAELKINARCDSVMRELARRLRVRVPRYRRSRDPLLAHATPLAAAERHTCSRPALPLAAAGSASSEPGESDSSSASDSDDAVPLGRLRERLRGERGAASGPRGPPDRPRPPPRVDSLRRPLRPVPGLNRLQRPADRSRDPNFPAEGPRLRSPPRRSRDSRDPAGRAPDRRCPVDGSRDSPALAERCRGLRPLWDRSRSPEARKDRSRGPETLEPEEKKPKLENGFRSAVKEEHLRSFEVSLAGGSARILLHAAHAPEPKEEEDEGGGLGPPRPRPDEDSESEASRAAAAFIARAVLVCRAELYPGLHTILARAPQPACAWCWRRHGSARCLWYPARDPQPPGRVWRRVRGRRYLCTCCPGGGGGGDSGGEAGEGGWYGKGYRKGRKKKR
ncbi:uncharacterized protein LOC134650779 [Cydia amplana]|uniref:uncharacterized protein LOC134650779 n=1 Tax=Cydia amplana TaxID=1869771 RepID=UPI002FE61C4E